MEDADKADFSVETLQSQYKTVRDETTKSEVLQWGQLNYTNEVIGEFEGGNFDTKKDSEEPKKHESLWHQLKTGGKKLFHEIATMGSDKKLKELGAVDSRDADLSFYFQEALNNQTMENF